MTSRLHEKLRKGPRHSMSIIDDEGLIAVVKDALKAATAA
jgi:hypothetical protein